LGALAALLLVALAACKPPEEGGPPPGPAAAGEGSGAAEMVESVLLNGAHFFELAELHGETAPIRAADISAQIGGRIIELPVEEGQWVTEGDTVLRMNARQGAATIDRMEVQLDQLEADIERTQRLIDRGLASEATLEQLQSQRDTISEGIDEVEVGMGEARTRAPISGTVTERFHEEGEFVAMGSPVARIVDLTTIVVSVGLPERDIVYVQEGQTVSVRIEATGEVLTGTLVRVGLEANPRNRTFPLEIHIENSDGHLRGGMRATAILVKRDYPSAVVIPRDSVLQAIEGAEVMVNLDGVAQARHIRLGPGHGRFVVVEEGLAAGDELIVRGHRDLVQGAPLSVSRSGECCREQLADQEGHASGPPSPTTPPDSTVTSDTTPSPTLTTP
jgi:membrane fusion protein (multidrug efflux system)